MTVNGQSGVFSAIFPAGTSENRAALNIYETLMRNPNAMEHVAFSAGSGDVVPDTDGDGVDYGGGFPGSSVTDEAKVKAEIEND